MVPELMGIWFYGRLNFFKFNVLCCKSENLIDWWKYLIFDVLIDFACAANYAFVEASGENFIFH